MPPMLLYQFKGTPGTVLQSTEGV